jgi:O-antigen/teichoic acid export membrane protein
MRSFHSKPLINRLIALRNQSLVTNAGYLMGIYIVNSIVGFLFWGVAAKFYNTEDVGLTSAVISAALLICSITDFGLSFSLIRYLTESPTPVKFLNTIFTFEILTSVLAGIAYLAGISILTPSLLVIRESWIYIVVFLVLISFFTMGSIVSRAFVARRKSIYSLLFNCVSNGFRLVLVILFMNLGSVGLSASMSLAFLVAASFSLFFLLPKVEPGYRFRPDLNWQVLRTILPYSSGNFIISLLSMVSQRLLPLLIIEKLGPVSNAHFYIAWVIGDFLRGPSSALSDSAFAEGSNFPEGAQAHLWRSAVIGLGVTLPASMIIFFGTPYILLFFGPTYQQEATDLLRILAIIAPLSVLSSQYFTILRVRERINQLMLVSALLAVVTLGITYAFIPRFGITAVGIGWLIGLCLTTFIAIIGLGWHKIIIAHLKENLFL